MIPFEDETTLSLLYHLNSEPWRNDDAYRSANYHQEFKEIEPAAERTTLPPVPDSALSGLIRRRRSCRAYLQRPMPLSCVSALSAAAYGIVESASLESVGTFLSAASRRPAGCFRWSYSSSCNGWKGCQMDSITMTCGDTR